MLVHPGVAKKRAMHKRLDGIIMFSLVTFASRVKPSVINDQLYKEFLGELSTNSIIQAENVDPVKQGGFI